MSESSDVPVVVQRGLWFEELATGVVCRHSPGRTISEARFPVPVRPGDTLYGETTGPEKRLPASRPAGDGTSESGSGSR